MQCNVGGTDRIARIVAGVVILGIGVVYKSWWGLIGLLPLVTGLIRWCPVYVPLKMSSAKPTEDSNLQP
jgi:hypothetical protein